jgi:NTE family protein
LIIGYFLQRRGARLAVPPHGFSGARFDRADVESLRLKVGRSSGKLANMTLQGPTAFVFAGGSSLGALQVGMLKALVSRGIVPDFVAGSSAGAINAAYFAMEPTAAGVDQLERIWCSLKRDNIFSVSRLGGLWGVMARRSHMVSPGGLTQVLEANLPLRELDQGKIPCCIVATDVLTGREFRIRSGPTIPALLASAAIPGIFPPVRLHGRHLVDGGVTSHTPLAAAIELGARTIFVMPTGFSCALSEPPRTAVEGALHALNLLISLQLRCAVQQFAERADIRIVPPLCPQAVSPYDFDRAAELIRRGEQSTLQWLDHGVELYEGLPHQLPPHSHDDETNPFAPIWN